MRHLWAQILLLSLISGCQQESESRRAPTYDTSLTVDEVMHLVIEPSADVIWDSAGVVMTKDGEESLAPTTEEGWLAVESAAAVILESGNLLNLPSRSQDKEIQWQQFSEQMSQVAAQARQAALDRNESDLFEAGADLYQSCVDCHAIYWVNTSE